MELEPTLIVSSVNLGTTIYGCYVETIDNTVYSFLRNTALLQPTEDHFETTSIKFDKSYGRYTDYGIYKMSIPFYNISSKAIAGYGFDRSPLNTDSTQSFR